VDVTKNPENFVVREGFVQIREHAVLPELTEPEVVFKVGCCCCEGNQVMYSIKSTGGLCNLRTF